MAKYYYKADNRKISRILKIIGAGCVLSGLSVFVYFFFPIIAYQFFLSGEHISIESPVPKYLVASNSNIRSMIAQGIAQIQFDYTDARNWYPQVHAEEKKAPIKVDTYYLSIPKLGIEDATVSTVDYDLSKNLVHYYGPGNPLDHGTSVIFGHSTIPQWFDPKNYKAIFATLHTIQVGDQIIITVNGQDYTYEIFSTTITTPDDVNIFSQSYDNSYITLVTCTPPGTTWKRLIVRAVLKS